MISTSAAFEAAMVQSHEPDFGGEVLDQAGVVLFEFDPAGSISIDRTSSQRRTAEWTAKGSLAELVPSGFDPAILKPFGTEVRLLRGVAEIQLLSEGIFRLTETATEVTLTDGIGCSFKGSDRSERLSRQLIAAFDAPEGSNYGDVIARLLQQAWQGASTVVSSPPLNFSPTDHLTPTLHFEAKTNAWEEARRMATACGKELFVDYEGVVVFADLPSIDDPSVWEFVDGTTDTRVRLGRRYSSANTPNYITVNGSGTGAADKEISGVAYVADTSSSINVTGAYGTSPKWIDSAYVTSNLQAEDQARAELAKVLAGTDTLEIDAVPNPALDAGDVVTVTAESLDIFDELYIINTITLPFDLETPMRVSLGRAASIATLESG